MKTFKFLTTTLIVLGSKGPTWNDVYTKQGEKNNKLLQSVFRFSSFSLTGFKYIACTDEMQNLEMKVVISV